VCVCVNQQKVRTIVFNLVMNSCRGLIFFLTSPAPTSLEPSPLNRPPASLTLSQPPQRHIISAIHSNGDAVTIRMFRVVTARHMPDFKARVLVPHQLSQQHVRGARAAQPACLKPTEILNRLLSSYGRSNPCLARSKGLRATKAQQSVPLRMLQSCAWLSSGNQYGSTIGCG
jgi:hypothetical protein